MESDVLVEKYQWSEKDAMEMADFLMPMLEYDPNQQATAEECHLHPRLFVGAEFVNLAKICE